MDETRTRVHNEATPQPGHKQYFVITVHSYNYSSIETHARALTHPLHARVANMDK